MSNQSWAEVALEPRDQTVDRRRSDTRVRIQHEALALFFEKGYEATSLADIADRLDVTRPALYYHFKTKQEILTSIVVDLGTDIADLVDWAASQPSGIDTRRELLRRVSGTAEVRWRSYLCFAHTDRAALVNLSVNRELRKQLLSLWHALTAPDADLKAQIRARLALMVVLGIAPTREGLQGSPAELAAAALDTALDLLT